MPSIDLNCDLGEGFPDDARLIGLVSSVNVACGGHAGDDETMRTAVRLATANGVSVGAHPGYEDRANFGRIESNLPAAAIRPAVERQVRRLATIVGEQGGRLRHVKPHGALYHAANRDAAVALAVIDAVRAIDATLAIVGPPTGRLADAARRAGLPAIGEALADRRYTADGGLTPRDRAGAVIEDPAAAAAQAIGIVLEGAVRTIDGTTLHLSARTLCVHGDGPRAAETLTALRRRLIESGVDIRAIPA